MNDCFLRTALGLNAAFSATTGILMTAMPTAVGHWIGTNQTLALQLIGISLILFAGILCYVGNFSRTPQFLAMLASLSDFVWVLATILLATIFPNMLSTTGWIIAGVVAAVVLGCGLAQAIGIDRIHRHPQKSGWLKLCLQFELDLAPRTLWSRIRDVSEIHRFAPSVAHSSLLPDQTTDQSPVRECRDHNGNCWREDLIIDDEHKRLHVRFHTEAPDFPFPFTSMEGGWQVTTDSAGSMVRVWWDVVPKRRMLSFLLMPLLANIAVKDFRQTVQNMSAPMTDQTSTTQHQPRPLVASLC